MDHTRSFAKSNNAVSESKARFKWGSTMRPTLSSLSRSFTLCARVWKLLLFSGPFFLADYLETGQLGVEAITFFFLITSYSLLHQFYFFSLLSPFLYPPPFFFSFFPSFFASTLFSSCRSTFFKEFSGQVQALEVFGFDSRPYFILFLFLFFLILFLKVLYIFWLSTTL